MKATNKPQKDVVPDKKKVTSNVARDDGVQPPKGGGGVADPTKPAVNANPPETKKA